MESPGSKLSFYDVFRIWMEPHRMSYKSRVVWFLFLNFSLLAVGSIFTGDALQNDDWYKKLNRAPWEPPGWVFGFAWVTIMICFSYYLAGLFAEKSPTNNIFLTSCLALNTLWSPLFFAGHQVGLALVVMVLLDLLIWFRLITEISQRKKRGILLLPYSLWLLIATSLNAWVLVMN